MIDPEPSTESILRQEFYDWKGMCANRGADEHAIQLLMTMAGIMASLIVTKYPDLTEPLQEIVEDCKGWLVCSTA